ncbi:Ovarian cancer-associated protein 2 [Chamberlinius hualienensis]
MASSKLKILCLHGYRQDGVSFKSKLGGFRKMLNSHVEFTFVTAPLRIPQVVNGDEALETVNQCGWWFSKDTPSFSAHDITNQSIGFEESIQMIEEEFIKEGPFDGIIGFSQGACLGAMLAGLQQINKLKAISFKFVILVAGFKSKSSAHIEFLPVEKIQIPSLHVYGETDGIIPKAMSEELLQQFENPEIAIHPGGHYVPASKLKGQYIEFLQKMKDQCLKQQ